MIARAPHRPSSAPLAPPPSVLAAWAVPPLSAALAALAAALCWTLSSLLWRRGPQGLAASELNLLKNLVALALQLPLLLALAQPWLLPPRGWLLLGGSGVLGIALGDSLFFAALRRLGSRRTLTIDAGGPAAATAAGALLLGERPALVQQLGIVLISLAVLLVARGGPPASPAPPAPFPHQPAPLRGGVALAIGALLCGSGGALLSRAALLSGPVTPLQAASLRLGAAALAGLLLLLRGPGRSEPAEQIRTALAACWVAWRSGWPWVLPATLLGTSAGILLQQMALAGLPGGLAVALLATAPVMALPLAWWLEGDPPGWRGTAAALAALVGVSLVAGPLG